MRLLLILGFLTSLSQGSVATVGNPPRLNVSEEYAILIHTDDDSVTMMCEGSKPLNWTWPTGLPEDAVAINDEHLPGAEFPYVSTLTVIGLTIYDTGFYYCHYSDATDLVTDKNNVDVTYMYVYDGKRGIIDTEINYLQVTTAQKLVIDCRTTLPNITVQLFKGHEEITQNVQWDPKIGFVRRNLAIADSGDYSCKSDNGDEKLIFVTVKPASSTLPKPALAFGPNQHFAVGHDFVLNCSLLVEKPVAFHWKRPNENANYNILPPSMVDRNGSVYRVSTLHVLEATKEDEGSYMCQVTATGMTENEETIEINITDTLTPYIELSGVEQIKLNEMGDLNWKSDFRAYPTKIAVIYTNFKGEVIKESERVTIEHRIEDAEYWLHIKNISASEFGNYTITGFIENDQSINDSYTVLVKVQSQPYAGIIGVPTAVDKEKTLRVSCLGMGFPLPSITWSFKECSDGPITCPNDYKRFEPQDVEDAVSPPGNIQNETISFDVQHSGVLQCLVKNKNGQSTTETDIIITDIGGRFILQHEGQNKTTDVVTDMQTIDVVENDDFYLECSATKYIYKDVTLKPSNSDLEPTRNETEFSIRSYIWHEKVTNVLYGTYVCEAETHDNKSVIRKLKINIKAEEPPRFTDEANVEKGGTTVTVKENDPDGISIKCAVRGTPTPTISWFKDDEALTEGSSFFHDKWASLSNDSQYIYIEHIYKETHTGTYCCRAENRLDVLEGCQTIAVPRPGLGTTGKVILTISCLGIAVLIITVLFLVKRVKKERKFRKSFRNNELFLFEKGCVGDLNPDCTADEQAELLPYDKAWEVARDNIKLGKQLGAGAFGRVVKALADLTDGEPPTTVAVKMCKSQADQSQVRALALELKIMIHLGQHLNIVNLMGANTVHIGKGELWILVEYCRFGNLLTFMHRQRKRFINQIDPVTDCIDFNKLARDTAHPMSPGSYNDSMRIDYTKALPTDEDGYLAPNQANFRLDAPPHVHTALPPPSPASITGSSNGSSRADGYPRHQVHNPLYSADLQKSLNQCPEGAPRTKRFSESSQGHPAVTRGYSVSSNAHSDSGSVGYGRESIPVVNTDMTVVRSSPMPPLLSPTESNPVSDLCLDSQGNPFVYDIGNIPGVTAPFTTTDLVLWAWQVAQGMDYLTRRKVLHGDLAARNLLLTDDNVVKISDFGLSREIYKKDVYMKKGDDLMPIKWMSVEAIRDRIFSVQSDVWAYGVALWEIFTLGSMPYPGVEVNKDFLKLIEDGHRMEKPKYANKELYDLMLQCWANEPTDRPSFGKATEHLGLMMQPDLRGQYVTMNDPYLRMNEERFETGTDYLNMLASPDFNNLNKISDPVVQYVNIEQARYEQGGGNYLNMNSPDFVSYSHRSPEAGDSAPKSQYLPMGSAQGSPSPMADIFSPRPDEVSRFTFGQPGTEKLPRLTELMEDEEPKEELASENSSLLNSESRDVPHDDVFDKLSHSESQEKDSINVRNSLENNEMTYINLPTHGTDNIDL